MSLFARRILFLYNICGAKYESFVLQAFDASLSVHFPPFFIRARGEDFCDYFLFTSSVFTAWRAMRRNKANLSKYRAKMYRSLGLLALFFCVFFEKMIFGVQREIQ